MVFPSVPLYLDPPTSWNQQLVQQQQQQQTLIGSSEPQQQQQQQTAVSRPDGPPRPNSMADRARLAKIPQPEQALKCPRCDSTNTKFCYFNNYSLSQPRHFCKTCRRYWTRGGALRNVPVGGGCRRNKRSGASSSAKSSSKSNESRAAGPSSSPSSAAAATSAAMPAPPPHAPQLPFMASLQHQSMMEYGGLTNIGLGFSGMQAMDSAAAAASAAGSTNGTSIGLDQWRMSQIHQFPFFGGIETQLPASGIYPFEGQTGGGGAPTGSELISQLASVKMEDANARGLNFAARQYNFGVGQRNSTADQFSWATGGTSNGNGGGEGSSAGGNGGGGGGWMTNLSGFNSSTTGSLL